MHKEFPRTFQKVFIGDEGVLATYWDSVQKEEWFETCPLKEQAMRAPHTVAPLRLHGDDAPVSKVASGLCMSLGSPISAYVTTCLSIFPIVYLLLKEVVDGAQEILFDLIVWSITACVAGKFPLLDWEKRPFETSVFVFPKS